MRSNAPVEGYRGRASAKRIALRRPAPCKTQPPVRVSLVHNPHAGGGRALNGDEILAAVKMLGWRVDVISRDDLDTALRNPGHAVLVAGGDGTVGLVAKRLVGTRIPVAVIPTGTVNNVARTLGIAVDARTAIESLRRAVVREVDLGVVKTERGSGERFIEGFSVGLFAWVMAERAEHKHKKPRRALELIASELEAYEPTHVRLEIDGKTVSGDCLIASAMNLRSLGPALGLAPDALWNDGMLDVVLVRAEHRNSLLAHLKGAATRGDAPLPRFEVHRGKRIRLGGHGGQGKPPLWGHVDDSPREIFGDVDVHVEPRAVRFFVPPHRGA
jgi:diacylglycerol kinase (ATP)